MRPRWPKSYRPDADDANVRTKYVGAEYCAGDSMKVINRQLEDLVYKDGLQAHEILGMIYNSLKVHYGDAIEIYEDGTEPEFYYGPRRKR